MSTIKPNELKKAAGLPDNANFHGWLIHNPEQDDFLLNYKDTKSVINKLWCAVPDQAMRFNRFTRAVKLVERLELHNRAIIVAAFDLGSQIVVLAPNDFEDRMSLPSSNPFRADSIKH
jgi:hypothetical protein|tara:strand:- start:40 stop:393 length:354 start_codon:yes stop_codon:yes gene_type:complete